MKVELIEYAGGDISIVNSARVSFDKVSDYEYELEENDGLLGYDVVAKLSEQDAKLVRYLAKHYHDTPFRHNFIQLRCSVPVFLSRQLMKHQAGLTWNEVSRRYVDNKLEFHIPKEWRNRPADGIKQGSAGKHKQSDLWQGVYKDHVRNTIELYESMVREGIAPEMARMVLPQSMMVDFIWSGNLLAFFHVWKLRSGAGAQLEAQEFAQLLKEAVRPVFPTGWAALEDRTK